MTSLSSVLDQTHGFLLHPYAQSTHQLFNLFRTYFPQKIECVFSDSPVEGFTTYGYDEDVAWTRVMNEPAPKGWVLVDNYARWFDSPLRYRLSDLQARGKGVLFFGTFGILTYQIRWLNQVAHQKMVLDMVGVLPELVLQIDGSEPVVSVTERVLRSTGQRAPVEPFGVLTAQTATYLPILSTSLSEKSLAVYRSETTSQDLFEFSERLRLAPPQVVLMNSVPPLRLRLREVLFADQWGLSDIWSATYQVVLQPVHTSPDPIVFVFFGGNPDTIREFMEEYKFLKAQYNELAQAPSLRLDPVSKEWRLQL